MRNRITISSLILIGIAIALVVGYWLLQPHPRIDQATYNKIKGGMTEREVIDIIGAPPGDYGLGQGELVESFPMFIPHAGTEKTWLGKDLAIQVLFDPDGKVTVTQLLSVWRPYDSHFDMMCQKLHLKEPKQRNLIGFMQW